MLYAGQRRPRDLPQREAQGVARPTQNPLDARSVLADEPGLHVLDYAQHPLVGANSVWFTYAGDALVGVDLEKYVIAPAVGAVKGFDVGDVHSRQPSRKLC